MSYWGITGGAVGLTDRRGRGLSYTLNEFGMYGNALGYGAYGGYNVDLEGVSFGTVLGGAAGLKEICLSYE
jgi:hypothetical protein